MYYSRKAKIFYLLNYSIPRESRSSKFKPSTSIYFSLVILFSLVIPVTNLDISIPMDPIIEDSKELIASLGVGISIYKVLLINNNLS
jgi:hypothetical protein